MTRLIALYPRAWRDRYETEFRALMAQRPPTFGDRVDIVRGAVDARLNPQIPGTPAPSRRPSRQAMLTGALCALAGLGWSAWIGLILRDFHGWGSGMPESANLMVALSVAGFLALTAAIVAIGLTAGSSMRPGGLPGGVLAGCGFTLTAFGGGMGLALALIGVAVLAGSMAGRVIPGWLAGAWIATSLLTLVAFVAFVAGNGRDVGLIALGLPFGIAWIVVGAAIAARGTPAGADAVPSL